jgi:predicted HTH transcriptional regulator
MSGGHDNVQAALQIADELIAANAEETLHLEFKTLSDSSGERLTKEDRRVLARAICGMANAEGGKIIIGIETKRVDNVDVAVAAKPIGNVERMRNLLVAAIPEMISPQHAGIMVTRSGRGFLVVDVPQSEVRPHYSNVHHQYFRRGSDGTRILEHAEIRELMFAIREAKAGL